MPIVFVPTAYRGPTRGVAEVEVEGATVRACIEAVEAQYRGFAEQVLDAEGRVHRFVKLFVDGEQIDNADVDRAVAPGARIEVLAALAGG